jgi:hypothetical protein
VDDISRFSIEDSSNSLIMERLDKNFRDMKPGVAAAAREYSVDRLPKLVSVHDHSPQVLANN